MFDPTNTVCDGVESDETRGSKMSACLQQLPLRGFMGDFTVVTVTHIQARWVYR